MAEQTVTDPSSGTDTPGQEQAEWLNDHDTLSEDARKLLDKYKTRDEALESIVGKEKLLGDPTRLPENLDGMSESQKTDYIARFGKLIGVPEKADGYELTMPEGVEVVEAEFLTKVKEIAAKGHVTHSTLQAFTDLYNVTMAERAEAAEQAKKDAADKATAAFKKELGKEYESTLKLIQKLAVNYAGESVKEQAEVRDCFDESGLGNIVPIMRMLNRMAKELVASGKMFPSAQVSGKKKQFLDYSHVDND